MIRPVLGYSGILVDIEDDDDLLAALVVLRNQTENFDAGHPVLEMLDNIVEELE